MSASELLPTPEQLAEWRADALQRGGLPESTDADPHARYLANRVVRLIDAVNTLSERPA